MPFDCLNTHLMPPDSCGRCFLHHGLWCQRSLSHAELLNQRKSRTSSRELAAYRYPRLEL